MNLRIRWPRIQPSLDGLVQEIRRMTEVRCADASSARPNTAKPHPLQAPTLHQVEERNRPFRILHVAEVIRGGTATYLSVLSQSQTDEFGIENLRFLVPMHYRQDIAAIPDELIATVSAGGRGLRAHVTYFRELRRVMHDFKPDLVHAHGSFGGLYVRLHAMLQGFGRRPIIVYCAHGWSFQRAVPFYKRWLYIAAERALTPFCDAVVNISRSEFNAALAIGMAAKKQVLVYNGLADVGEDPMPTSLPSSNDKLILLFVGRLDVQKGIDILIEVLRSLDPDRYRLFVAGEAVVPGEDLSRRLGPIPDNVTLLGWQSPMQLKQLYAGADAVVIPSRWEGFGYVALEAMRASCAVIASRSGGLPEIIEHGKTGLLFDIDDARQLKEIIDHGSRAAFAELGRNGRDRFVAEFTADRMNTALLGLYRTLRVGSWH
ncbi:MAG: glycosyl transferase [Rhodospirillales bacterium]|nr:glycosyl transferase [Rhodospirillales bacterium]